MKKAARAIVIDGNKILVMRRKKYGNEYYTLVGGRVDDDETLEQGLTREVKEETGLDVVKSRLVYIEEHAQVYSHQYIYLCEVAPFETAAIQDTSEEGAMNKLEANIHELAWVEKSSFERLPFRTPQLQAAVIQALKEGFPDEPQKLTDQPQRQPKKSVSARIRRRLPF